jgi:hypothetical protein
VILLIGVNATPDPTRRGTGFGGVLPVPVTTSPTAGAHVDPLLAQQRRELRAARGRVLYTPGHVPDADHAKVEGTRAEARTPCPRQRIVQVPRANAAPFS